MKSRLILITVLVFGGAAGLYWAWSRSNAARLERAIEHDLAARLLPHVDDPTAIAAVVAAAQPVDVVAAGLAGEASFVVRVAANGGDFDLEAAVLDSFDRRAMFGLLFERQPVRAALAEHVDRLVDMRAACRLPFGEAVVEFARFEDEARRGERISRALFRSYGRFVEQEMTGRARADALRLGAAAISFRTAHGRLPEDLVELGDARPRDPRSGGDFLLTEEDGRLVVASASDEGVRLVF